MSPLARFLNTFLPADLIEETLREHKAFQRVRRMDPVLLVFVLILGASSTSERCIDALRRTYERHAGHRIAKSSFYHRLSPALEAAMRALMEHAMGARAPAAVSHAFSRVLALDATIVRLCSSLSSRFPGCQPGQAGLKLQVAYCLTGASPAKVKVRSEKTSDQACWRQVGPWVKGALMVVDLGYYC